MRENLSSVFPTKSHLHGKEVRIKLEYWNHNFSRAYKWLLYLGELGYQRDETMPDMVKGMKIYCG